MIIFRYLVKEVVTTVIATTTILLLIFMSTQFVHYLSDAAMGRFSGSVLIHIMVLQVPYLLGLLIPLGFYLAILTAYGRLYVDREMMVFSSCGISSGQILAMTMMMAVIVAVIVSILTCWLAPYVATAQKRLMAEAKSAPLVETVMPGRFYALDNGQQVFYVENVSRDHKKLKNIFVAKKETKEEKEEIKETKADKAKESKGKAQSSKKTVLKKINNWSVISAATGFQTLKHGHQLVISNGFRYSGTPGENSYKADHFGTLTWNLHTAEPHLRGRPETIPTSILLGMKHRTPEDSAELQWRLSMPLSVLLLGLLAVPLSRVNPRQGKFAQILPAVLIYIFYANMMFVGRDWIQSKAISPYIGLWWLHALLLITALLIMFFRSNVKERLKRRFA